MPDRELISTYLDGQIGRRAFIRNLLKSGISLAAALAYARVLGADPAEATHDGAPDEYNENRLIKVSAEELKPLTAKVKRGGLVQWDLDRVTQEGAIPWENRRYEIHHPMDLFDYGPVSGGHTAFQFFAAGTFPYQVDVETRENVDEFGHPGFTPATPHAAKVQALVAASKAKVRKGSRVTISWATTSAPDGFVYDVQWKKPGGKFKNWKTGVTAKSAKPRLKKKGKHVFRGRLRRTSGAKSGYSPGRAVKAT